MPPPSPAVAQWSLTVRLRERRRQLQLDAQTISKRLGLSRTYWSAVENDRTILARDKLETLADILEFSSEEAAELLRLREEAKQHRWWEDYDQIGDDLLPFYGLEYGAKSVKAYGVIILPGLLQTEEYARTVISTDPDNSPRNVSQLLDLRIRRQERLFGEDPLVVTAMLHQTVLMQEIGGPQVLHDQLVSLAASIQRNPDTLTVKVLPFKATPLGLAATATLLLLDFDDPFLPTVAYRESVTTLGTTDDHDIVDFAKVSFSQAEESCLDPEESLKLILTRVDELKQELSS